MNLGFLQRGSRKANDRYVGPKNTFSLDTDGSTLRLHDGETPGGKVVSGLPLPPKGPAGTFYALKGDEWVPVNVQEVIAGGPGSKEPIAGSQQEGFFGEVSSSDLFNGDELAMAVGLSEGSSVNADSGWLKFISGGKTLFIAKKPLRHNLSWADIYTHGLVYGESGIGVTPVKGGVDQLMTASKNATDYIVRCLRGADIDPTGFPQNDYYIPGGDQSSEWARLIARIHESDGSWGMYTSDDIGIGWNYPGAHTLCQETFSADTKQRVFRGIQDGNVGYIGSARDTTINYLYGWRPVLEVVNQ